MFELEMIVLQSLFLISFHFLHKVSPAVMVNLSLDPHSYCNSFFMVVSPHISSLLRSSSRIRKYASAISRNFFSSLDANLWWISQPAANIMAICKRQSMWAWTGPPMQYLTWSQKECFSSVEYSVGPWVAIVIIGRCWWWEQRRKEIGWCEGRSP